MLNRKKSINKKSLDVQADLPVASSEAVAEPEVNEQVTPEVNEQVTPEVNEQVTPEVNEQVTPEVNEQADDSWLNELTPYESQPANTSSSDVTQSVDDKGTDEQQARLAELYAGFENVDEDTVRELHAKLIAPEVQALRADIAKLQQYKEREQQAKQTALLVDVNTKIFAKYPKADSILRSKEFMDYVNLNNNPYSTETEFDIFQKAYYAGDANYVLNKIDGFVSSRGKPKPQVGVEPLQSGDASGVKGKAGRKRAMTEAEYLAKRKAIRTAPKGTYPPNALRDLVNEYIDINNRG